MENLAFTGLGSYVDIAITSLYECKYDIYIGKSKIPFDSGTVSPKTPKRVTFDWNQLEAKGSEIIQERAIHLVSDNPLNVFAMNWGLATADAAIIFPTESLGKEYYAMCYSPGEGWWYKSEFMIVASEDNTVVNITPAKVTDGGKPAKTTYSITLNKGELYQVQSGKGDLTGSYIKSDKPVAIYSGSKSTIVPGDARASADDHLYEQIPPLQTWGRKFIAIPLKPRLTDTYRVLAAEDNTTVHIGNKTPVLLNKGQYSDFMLMKTEPSLIESDKPVLLAQFSNSLSFDGIGDPFMVIVSPVNQAREKVAFFAYGTVMIRDLIFVNVVVKDDAVGKINLDNVPVTFLPLNGTGYSYAQVNISAGYHTLASIEPGKGFIAYVYGFGWYESYGYGLCYDMDIGFDRWSNMNEKLLVRCDGDIPLTLKARSAFDHYLWNTGDTTSAIQVTNEGMYYVKYSNDAGCIFQDTVDVMVSKPIINLGRDTTICDQKPLILDVGDQFTNYLWTTPHTTITDQKITVSKPGTYSVETTNKYGCKVTDTIKVSFADKPRMDLSMLDTMFCGNKTAILDVKSDKGDFTIQRLSDGFISNGKEVTVPDFGTYDLKIKVTDEFSCFSDSVIKIGFRKTPSVDFSVDSVTCYGYNLDVNYLGDARVGASEFVWIFGGDTIKRGIGVNSYVFPLGINRATRDLKLKVTDNGCSNEKTIIDIKVIPNLKMMVTDSLGCEPFKTQFMANNTETVTYDWDFGDKTVLNGLTANPSHTYQNDGYYCVKLKVTTNKGCTNEARIDSMIYVAPVPTMGFTPLPPQCFEFGDHSISYTGTGDNQDTYNWNILAFDPEEIIQNPNTTLGPFIFNLKNKPQATIMLNVLSKYGCRSVEDTVIVKRKPDFSINPSSISGCVPFKTVLSGIINDKVDDVIFNWDFGDGTAVSGWQKTHIYDQPGKSYNITLSGTSSQTGCSNVLISNDLLKTYPKPRSAFGMDNTIVYNDKPTVNFSNLSMGATEYLWDFGDGLTSGLKDPSHDYAITGYRTVLLEAFNEFHCSDTISRQILVAFDRIFPPNAFSPNAPNEVDREFKPGSIGVSTEGYHLTILSRWNDIVFEARDEIKGWDGQMKNGSFAAAGVYVWILNFNDFLGRKHRQTGTVTLVY